MKHYPEWRRFRWALIGLFALAIGGCVALCVNPGDALAQEKKQTDPQKSKDEKAPDKQTPTDPNSKPLPKSQRWQVSWGVDPDTTKMNVKPVPTTIARLIQFKRPADMPGEGTIPENYRTHRISPPETTVWSVKATLVEVAAEHDGDYRLTLEDEKGGQIIGVLPDPALAPKTGRFTAQINAARKYVVDKFHPTFDERKVSIPIEIVGTGYFGRFNKEENPSPEGFQLHPVFSVRIVEAAKARK